jgi:outer membrane lipoprotein-sorting protein
MFAMIKAAVVLAGAAGVAYFTAFPTAPASAEFVEAARKLQAAQTLSFRMSTTIAGQPEPMNARMFYKVPGLCRTEPDPAGSPVSVLDFTRGKSLILNPADKSAMVLEEPPAQAARPAQRRDGAAMMIEDMRRLAQKDGEPVGERVIGDVRARGFRVKEQGQDITVWVDPQKKLPILIEFTGTAGNLEFRGTYSDIQLDPPLDDALFRLDPPAGYAVRRVDTRLQMTFEEAVARHLRTYADASGGRFPARLDDFAEMQKLAVQKKAQAKETKAKETKGILNPEAFQAALAGAHVAAYCMKFKDQYGYKADGVKLGDARTIIFWYKPEGQEKYKVVYGDLHIGEVAASELPLR